MSNSELKLYSYFRSSCSARVRHALLLKNIDYEYIPVNLLKGEQSSDDNKARNPSQYVPTLAVGNNEEDIYQSLAIIEYLEEAYPEKFSLLPPASDIIARSHVRALAYICACDTQPLTNLAPLKHVSHISGDSQEWARCWLEKGLKAYDLAAREKAGLYSYGDTVSLADVCLAPTVEAAKRFKVDLDQSELQVVMKVYDNLCKLPAFIEGHWKNQIDTPEELKK